jgi:hypothetical protein
VRSRIAPAVVLLSALIAAPPATAKEDVRARLENRLALDAPAGTTITVAWRLYYVEDGRRRPFGASELFVRLRSATGARGTKAYGEGRNGRYTTRIKVPRGRMAGIRFGLDGIRMLPDGRTQPAPIYFPLDNDPFR